MLKLVFNVGNNKKYKIDIIENNAIYTSKKKSYLPSLYYLLV